jgi:hypothetical protein
VPGLSALDSQPQVLAYALVLGYAQQAAATRFLDDRGQTILNRVASKDPEGRQREPCAYRLLVRVNPGQIGYPGVMGEAGYLAQRYLLDRALSGRRTRRPHVRTRRHVHGPRPRGRFGFWGPVPYYTTRTRRGSEVSAGGCGCCLPIPLIGALGAFGALRALARRLRSRHVVHEPQGLVV